MGEEIWFFLVFFLNGEMFFIGLMVEDLVNVFVFKIEIGEIMWESGIKGFVFFFFIVSYDDKIVFFCLFDVNCYVFSIENGKEFWVF